MQRPENPFLSVFSCCSTGQLSDKAKRHVSLKYGMSQPSGPHALRALTPNRTPAVAPAHARTHTGTHLTENFESKDYPRPAGYQTLATECGKAPEACQPAGCQASGAFTAVKAVKPMSQDVRDSSMSQSSALAQTKVARKTAFTAV